MRAETDRRRPPLPSSSPQEEQVVNIALTHDIVPRAFACDYSRVVGILKRLNRGFKEHHGLAGRGGARKAMFAPIGHLLALQPSEDLNFVKEGPHPMLPAKPGLFHISSPRGDADSPRSPRRRGVSGGRRPCPRRAHEEEQEPEQEVGDAAGTTG